MLLRRRSTTIIKRARADFFSRISGGVRKVTVKAEDAFIITPKDIHNYHINGENKYSHKDIYVTDELMRECCNMVSTICMIILRVVNIPRFLDCLLLPYLSYLK